IQQKGAGNTRDSYRLLSSELSWSHYQCIMRVADSEARTFYMRECVASNWGVRELKRQIDTRLYERLLHTQEAKALEGVDYSERALTVLRDLGGIKDAETNVAMSPFKDPYVFEFADIPRNQHVLETDLESVLIDSLEEFLLELGRGFSFVKRQRHLSDNGEDWWVDLVFYNYHLRRFVLFDLKTGKLDPRDVGQMDFYLNFFNDKYKLPDDDPSIGILLCSEKDEAVAKYSALARNDNLHAAQYFTYLPTEEELAEVLRRNRAEFEERLSRARLESEDGHSIPTRK
ncbi:MAG: PDDEXK nuclease domain-containing protein, partial [Atopobiaceae bacterium]|nr:PDDEXK nuclease domain-containing protein [Atopobiaceae bacterium]